MVTCKCDSQVMLMLAAVLWPGLSALYYCAAQSLYDDVTYYNHHVPTACWTVLLVSGAALVLVVGLIAGQAMFDCDCVSPLTVLTFFLTLVMFGTVVDLLYMVRAFPYACDFWIPDQQAQKVIINYATGAQSTVAKPYDVGEVVDCDESVTLFGIRGGREPTAILAHMLPLLFGATVTAIAKADRAAVRERDTVLLLADAIDMQDFFLLLQEDSLILAFWDIGHGSSVYTWISTCFVVGAVYILGSPVMQMFLRFNERHKRIIELCASLFLFNIPYLLTRAYCSKTFDIIASSLLTKNTAFIAYGAWSLYGVCSAVDDGSDSEQPSESDEPPDELAARLMARVEKYGHQCGDPQALLQDERYMEVVPTIEAPSDDDSDREDEEEKPKRQTFEVEDVNAKMKEAAQAAAGQVAQAATEMSAKNWKKTREMVEELRNRQAQEAEKREMAMERQESEENKVNFFGVLGADAD